MESINLLNIAAVPAITVIAFLVAQLIKQTPLNNAWLPPICGLVGGILGVTALFTSPQVIPATDIFNAASIGIVSGLAATGAHQIYKQAIKAAAEADKPPDTHEPRNPNGQAAEFIEKGFLRDRKD